MKIDFFYEANLIEKEIINFRREIHQCPELGFEEFETSKFIKNILEKENIEFEVSAKTGIIATIEGEKNTLQNEKVIAARADMDALPIQEEVDWDFKSKVNGRMHACGHDAHIAILLGVAIVLNKYKNCFSGGVKLIFEPAEESFGGAKYMLEEGLLENHKINKMIGLHVEEGIDTGKVMIKQGSVNAASNPFKITIKGSGGHGAYPSQTVDPILIGAKLVSLLQCIISREIPATSSAVITVGEFIAGTAPNIIPNKAVLKGIIRTLNEEERDFIIKRVKSVTKGLVQSMRGEALIEIEESYPSLINNEECVKLIREAGKSIIGEKNILSQQVPKLGVESFAYFSRKVDSAFYFLGIRNENKECIYPAHSSLFKIDEDALKIGVAIQCQAIFNYLTK
ncbi:MAG: M20 metallopeptidase family protein [Sarcina sp.]